MSENTNYKIIKTTPEDVLFIIHPVSNPMLSRRIYLTKQHPMISLPLDWALGVFQDEGVYQLYKSKSFTFDNNESIVKAAFEAGVYFDDKLDFTPASVNNVEKIFNILAKGNRQAILDLVESEGADTVKTVAISRANDLTQGVINMLENIFKIQLTVDGE